MIAFKDFVPKITAPAGFLKAARFESLPEVADAATRWCDGNAIVPLNVETVVLPNIHRSGEEGSGDASLETGQHIEWNQIIRVWYLAK